MRISRILLVLVCVLGQLVGTCYARDLRDCCRDGQESPAPSGCGSDLACGDAACGGNVPGGSAASGADAGPAAGHSAIAGPGAAAGPDRDGEVDGACPLDCEDCVLCACCTLQMNATTPTLPTTGSLCVPSGDFVGMRAPLLSSDPNEIPHPPKR